MADIFREFEAAQEREAASQGTAITKGDTVQKMEGKYATAIAVQRPRELPNVQNRFLQECTMAGESFYYSWSVGGNSGRQEVIEGPSIGMAMALVRAYGNCVVDATDVVETETAYVITSSFVDLETGATISRPFRQSKRSVVAGKLDAARKEDVRFQIAASKSMRNVVLNALPKWLVDKGLECAKAGTRQQVQRYIDSNGKAKAIQYVVKALAGVGVTEEDIMARMGIAKIEALDIDAIVMLRGDLSVIQQGTEFPEAVFPNIAKRNAGGAKAARAGEDVIDPDGKPDDGSLGNAATSAFFDDVNMPGEASVTQVDSTTPGATEQPETSAEGQPTNQAPDESDAATGEPNAPSATISFDEAKYSSLPRHLVKVISEAATAKAISNAVDEFVASMGEAETSSEAEEEEIRSMIALAGELAENRTAEIGGKGRAK